MSVSKVTDRILGFYFLIVAVLMYYFLTAVFQFKVHITYRHVFALVLAISGVLCFLIKPNIARGVVSFKSACVYSAPLLVTIVVSLFIWSVELANFDVISRGISGVFIFTNILSSALAGAALLYIFGEKGLWYNLLAIIIANLLMIATIIVQYGFGNYVSELITLIITFADETGDIIIKAEVHELAFCLGAYMVYMLFKPRKNSVFWLLFILAGFCFVSAFKRIAIIAIVLAVGIGWFFIFISKRNDKLALKLTRFFTVIIILLLIGYVAIIKMDVFALIEEAGVNTSGRVAIYDAVDEFYEFSPSFIGNGIGFLTYQLNTNLIGESVGVAAIHNDFLQFYIDLGFFGYILWLFSMTLVRINHFARSGNTENAVVAFILLVYLVIVSSTDNTMNYPLLTTVIAILMIGHGYDDKVRKTELKIFGYVSDANKCVEGGAIL